MKKKINDQTILIADVVNGNGRMYSKECIERMASDLEGKQIFGTIGYQDAGDISKTAFMSKNFKVEDNKLKCDNIIMDTPCGNVLKTLLSGVREGEMVFRPAMYGNVTKKDDIYVNEKVTLHSVAIINKEDDSFKDNE